MRENNAITLARLALALAALALGASGCSTFHFEATLPDGTVVKASHRNFFQSRTLTGKTPSGFEVTSEVNNKEASTVINNIVEQVVPIVKVIVKVVVGGA